MAITKAETARGSATSDSPTAPAVSSAPRNVYALIAAVSAEIALTGISKSRENQQQHYKFRGIDDVYNALAPILAKHRLIIVPRILARECVERTAKSGSAQFFVTVEAEFDFVSADDSSKVTARTFGEAQDSADKATNKAMSAAYKYAAFQTFCIPTEGDNDADATTAEPTVPSGEYQRWLEDLEILAAEQGYKPLVEAIGKSVEAFRAKLRADAKTWGALKARAEATDARTVAA